MKQINSSTQKSASKEITPIRVALLYAALTAVWLVASGKLHAFAVHDMVLQGYIELAECSIFIAVTSSLLYLLLKGRLETEDNAIVIQDAEMPLGRLILVFAALTLVVPLIGVTIAKLYGSRIEQEVYASLEAIARLKAEQIENWLGERQGDSVILMSNVNLIKHIEQFTQKQTGTAHDAIQKQFEMLRSSYGYDSILLLNPNGQLLFASGSNVEIPIDFQQLLRQSLISKQGQRGDFYRDKQGNIHLDWVIPILITDAQGEHAIASMVLRTTGQRFLFPLIQTWPTSSPSAETLLVRRDGESVLYLNTLRHRANTALLLSLPLNQPKLPAALAILSGKSGTFKGFDYRNVEVLGTYRPIKNTNWYIIAKIDRDEVLTPLHQLVLWVSLIAFIAVIAISITLLVLWRRQQAQNLLLLAHEVKHGIADRSLQQSIESTQALMNAALDAVVSIDNLGIITGWNPQAEVIFGYSQQQTIGRNITELIVLPAHRQAIARFLATTTKTILGKHIETQVMRADGTEFPIELTVLELVQNQEQFFTAYIRDITKRKQAEEEVRLSKAKLEAALASMNDAVYISDTEGRFIEFNEAFAICHKFRNKEECPKILSEYPNFIDAYSTSGEFLPLEQRPVPCALRGETGTNVELTLRRKDTGETWIGSYNYAPIRNDDDIIVGAVVTTRDITEHKQHEVMLIASEKRYRSLFNNMQEGFAYCRMIYEQDITQDFVYLEVNPAFEDLTGLKDVTGKKVSEVIPGIREADSAIFDFYSRVASTGKPEHMEFYIKSMGVWFSVSAYSPEVDYFIAIFDVITERKQAEALLRESEEKLRLFIHYSPSAIAMFDRDMRYMAYSHRWLVDYGLGEQELVGRSHYDVFPDLPGRWKELHRRSLAGSIEKCDKDSFPRTDGSVEWVRWEMHPWLTSEGNIGGVIIFSELITDRVVMEETLVASEREFRLLAESMPQIVWIASADGKNIYHNQQWVDYTGLSLEEGYGLGWCKSLHPDDTQSASDAWEYAVNHNAEYSLECQLRRADGIYRWWLVRGTPIFDGHGKVCKWFGTCTDIHEIKEAERVLREEERLLADSQAIAHVGSWMMDINTGTITWSEETFRLYDLSPLTDKPPKSEQFFELLHPDDRQRMKEWLDDISSGKQVSELEFRTYPVNGNSRYLLRNGVLETDSIGKPLRIIGTEQDITERKKAEETIYDLAFYDPLTHLPNRRLMIDRLQQALISRKLKNRYGAILFIDLKNFKNLNDTKGHDIGDLLLIEVSRHLQSVVHEDDTIARTGGDEFVVLLDRLDPATELAAAQAESVAKRILASISQPFNLQNYEYPCSASIGIALFHSHEISVEELLKQADIAMNQAKQFGYSSIQFFDPEIQIKLEFRVQLESWMRKALHEEYKLYFQIQIGQDNNATGAEVLIRWDHPELGIISPADFIPLAEETGLIIPIGQWVLEAACKQLKVWEQDQKTQHLILAVNVSAKQFNQPDFVKQVLTTLDQTGANPDRLKLELTESMLAHNVKDIIAKMSALKVKGVRFSLDDFGTGFSSLSYLKRLPFNQLKIDQSFVRDALIDPSDAAIIRTIIDLGQSLGMEVIAEGVETEEQRHFLAAYGCKHYQGYLFSKPLPLDEFEQLLCNKAWPIVR